MEDINTLTQKANSGDAVAMRKLGYEYLIGKNIQKDEKKAKPCSRPPVLTALGRKQALLCVVPPKFKSPSEIIDSPLRVLRLRFYTPFP